MSFDLENVGSSTTAISMLLYTLMIRVRVRLASRFTWKQVGGGYLFASIYSPASRMGHWNEFRV